MAGDISDNAAFLIRHNPHTSRFCINKLLWYPTKRCFTDVVLLTEDRLYAYYKSCLKIKPVYLQGYVGAVQEFAAFLQRKRLSIPSLEFIWTTAAPLSESNRTFMENVFNCPVYNQYGCCEVFWLACECKMKTGLHIFDTMRYFEVCDENNHVLPDGTEGELLITDLLNQVFPLIRYRNGNRVIKLVNECSCGCKFPLIASVNGRITDIIRLPNNNSVPGDFMTTIFDATPDAVAGFQIIQHRDYSLTLKYIPTSSHSKEIVNGVCDALKKRFEKYSIDVIPEAVDIIKHDRGKTRFIISEINQ